MAFHEGDIDVTTPALGYIALLRQLQLFISNRHVSAVAINAAGTGYTVGNILTVAGGTLASSIFPATIEVTAVSSGAITGARLVNWGAYTADPTVTANAATGGSGSGATFNLTMIAGEWTIDRSTYTNDQTQFQLITHGDNAAGADPYIGIATFVDQGNPQWQLRGFTGFNSSLTFNAQPGATTGFEFGGTVADCPRIPLSDSDIHFYFFVNARRIIVVARILPTYEMCYLGLFTPFVDSPTTKYPLPLLISGTTVRNGENIASAPNSLRYTIVHHAATTSPKDFVRMPDGLYWRFGSMVNALKMWPRWNSLTNVTTNPPNIATGSGDITAFGNPVIDDAWLDGGQGTQFAPAPFGVGARTYFLCPCTLYRDQVGATDVIGELDGVFKVPGRGIAGDNRVVDQFGGIHVVFPELNSNDITTFYTIREE